MYLKISAKHELFNPKEELRVLQSGPHWLAPYQESLYINRFSKLQCVVWVDVSDPVVIHELQAG